MTDTALFQALLYLLSAVVAVPLARRLGLGSVLGYLLAGVIIGPHVLGHVGAEGATLQHFAEFGVVMMLLLIGLELEPARLWKLRTPIFGLGGLQVGVTAALLLGVGLILGTPWQASLVLGLSLAMSSTAIALQTLKERGLDRTEGGRASLAVLLFQDLAVLPVMALLPLLATTAVDSHEAPRGIGTLPGWLQALSIVGAVVVIVISGRYLSRPIFRAVAAARMHEVFIALALLLVVGITLLMHAVGLSPALGAFVAGVVLANSEYRHELVADIEPFKGLLLGLFFITVGSGIDFPLLALRWPAALGLLLGVMVLKAAVILGLCRAFRMPLAEGVLVSTSLCQVGEFAFVVLGLAASGGVLDPQTSALFTGVAALSMAAFPLVFLGVFRWVLPRLSASSGEARAPDVVEPEGAQVLVAGFGRLGNLVGRLLRAQGIRTTVLEQDPSVVDMVRKVGLHAWYGDASRMDLLRTAGAEHARLLILALDDPDKALEIAEQVRQTWPHLQVLARVPDAPSAYRFLSRGYTHVYREVHGTALEMGYDALRLLGHRGHHAHRAVQAFRRHNQQSVQELARHWGDQRGYFSRLKQKIEEGEELLRRSRLLMEMVDHAWDNTSLREDGGEEPEDPGPSPAPRA